MCASKKLAKQSYVTVCTVNLKCKQMCLYQYIHCPEIPGNYSSYAKNTTTLLQHMCFIPKIP